MIFGVGKNRRMRPGKFFFYKFIGEEALIVETIERILEECNEDPKFLTMSLNSKIIEIIIRCD